MTELLVAGVKPCVPQEALTLPGGVPMTFSFVPPGAFLMGSEKSSDDEKPVHRVEVPQGFFMGMNLVTQSQWKAVVGTDPSYFKGARRPVENVSWDDSWEFCTKLTELTGRRVELPRETEWEFTCRAGTTTEYHFGDVINTNLANCDWNSPWNDSTKDEYRKKETTDVGSFPVNPWGLHDLHGNVWEWCASVYCPYPVSRQDSNQEYSNNRFFVLRGGSWLQDPVYSRAAKRFKSGPTYSISFVGFRVCLRLS
jgi:formylglycine-generating enzyme required for sulfatase activity